ncbi:hypothetical protein ACP70R_028018 [Stipagrostis hirtigluma subsp. patula]
MPGDGRDANGKKTTLRRQWRREDLSLATLDHLLRLGPACLRKSTLTGRGGFCRILCSCDVAPVTAELTGEPPWTLGKDKLFHKELQLHLGAKLLYMGDSKFCLVESLLHRDNEHMLRDPMAHAGGPFP